jgi:hypothetical protein
MQKLDHAIASTIVHPQRGDWIFRIKLADGRVLARRVSPPTLTREQAQQRVLLSFGRDAAQVADIECWRSGEVEPRIGAPQ